MIYVILGTIILLCLIYSTRYIIIGEHGSLIGIIFRNIMRFATYTVRNHRLKIKEEFLKLNKLLKWNVKEGDFKKYSIKKIDVDGLETAMLIPNKNRTKKVILQLHGGGYEVDLNTNDLYFAKKYNKVVDNVDIFTINYRVAPEYKFPAAFEDAIKAYKYLLSNGYNSQDIIIAGDSAGGGLTLATVMYLRDNNLELPRALITMSAWTDLTNEEYSFERNFKKDAIFGNSRKSIVCTSTYAEGMDKKNPYISPMYGSFENFPDTLMQVGSYEMLLSDTVDVAKKMQDAGVNIKVSVYNGMFHNFQKNKNILPEADRAWREIKEFLYEKFEFNK